jgi:hypothetical protein
LGLNIHFAIAGGMLRTSIARQLTLISHPKNQISTSYCDI